MNIRLNGSSSVQVVTGCAPDGQATTLEMLLERIGSNESFGIFVVQLYFRVYLSYSR